MAARGNNVLRLVTPPADTARLLAQGLVDLYKAVKGASFYPDGHPYRTAPLDRAFETLARLVEKRDVVVTVGRHGFTPALESADGSVMLQQLAQECLTRRIAIVTFTPGLVRVDLERFVELLSCEPHRAAANGGFGRALEAAGVRTVRVQERDLSPAWARRPAAARGGENDAKAVDVAKGAEVAEVAEVAEDAASPGVTPGAAAEPAAPHTVAELLRLMAHEDADARYQELGRELADTFAGNPAPLAVVPVLEELLRQHRDAQRSWPKREYALFTLERLAEVNADLLLDLLVSKDYPDREAILRVLAALGGKGAYRIIQRLCLADAVTERKALAAAVVRLGTAALSPVIAMLKDDRWYVVRNMATILGEIRAPEAVPALKKPLGHPDERVRKEAVRALMKTGGEQAEAALIALLEQPDEGLVRHAIISLGLMRSVQAVPPLTTLVERQDLFLRQLSVKKEAVLALGRIGDRTATAVLVTVLRARGWPVVKRWSELKIAAASSLGTLGDEAALPALHAFAKGRGALAESCREAVEAIERLSEGGR